MERASTVDMSGHKAERIGVLNVQNRQLVDTIFSHCESRSIGIQDPRIWGKPYWDQSLHDLRSHPSHDVSYMTQSKRWHECLISCVTSCSVTMMLGMSYTHVKLPLQLGVVLHAATGPDELIGSDRLEVSMIQRQTATISFVIIVLIPTDLVIYIKLAKNTHGYVEAESASKS